MSPIHTGTYYLNITTYDNDAVDTNNPIFDLATDPSAIVRPVGTGGDAVLDHWRAATPRNGEMGHMLYRLQE